MALNRTMLIDEYPILVYPSLAVAVGLNEAIVLQQVHYWLEANKKSHRNYRDGYYWVYNTYAEWRKQFPFWSDKTLRRTFTSLEKTGYLISANFNRTKMDQTKWYRIDYTKFDNNSRLGQNDQMEKVKMTRPIPETNTETNNGTMEEWFGAIGNNSELEHNATPQVEYSDDEISGFIKWYYERYEQIYGEEHPKIKSKQKVRVHNVLRAFCDENALDSKSLRVMAESFFYVQESDHNINHFATDGILLNRYYEELY